MEYYHMKRQLTQNGFAHYVLLLGFIVLFGVLGTYLLLVSHAATVTKPSKPITWLINTSAISHLQSAGASTSLINTAFSNKTTYVISGSGTGTLGVPTATYGSYQGIVNAFASGALPGHFKAVIYDNENWSLTPTAEQKDPEHYDYLASQLIHQHKMIFIATPAADIVKASGTSVSNLYTTYLQLRIAAHAARYADVIDLQAQGTEANLSQFTSFVSSAAQQARQANPNVRVLVGLSTNPAGRTISSTQLYNAYNAARPYTDGYWLNIPGQSTQCPSCGAPQPKLALALLQKVY
jgi:hypothetical protein